MLGAVAPLAKILFNTIEKSVPDKDLQEKLKAQLDEIRESMFNRLDNYKMQDLK